MRLSFLDRSHPNQAPSYLCGSLSLQNRAASRVNGCLKKILRQSAPLPLFHLRACLEFASDFDLKTCLFLPCAPEVFALLVSDLLQKKKMALLHTSKTLDGLHKLLPSLLHTKRKSNDQKKTKSGSLSRGPCVPAVFCQFWRFFAEFFKKTRFFDYLKNRAFF